MARVPSLVAFDLDDTLWSPEMWECSGPPFKTQAGRVYDRSGTEIELIGASQRVLHELATQVCVQHAGHYSRKTTHAKTRLHHVERASVVRAGLFRPAPRRSSGMCPVRVWFGHGRESRLELGRRVTCWLENWATTSVLERFGVSYVSRRCLVSVHLRVRLRACTGPQPSSWLACASASVVVCVVRVGTCNLRGGAGRQGGIQGMRTGWGQGRESPLELGRRVTRWLENPGRRTSVLESLHHSLHSARRA